MQTFLPFEDFAETAEVLDLRRLGKQRVETMQIMSALLEGRGWTHHPATLMWAGAERALMKYQEAICDRWMSLGYKDTCLDKSRDMYVENQVPRRVVYPEWLGLEELHLGYQSNLVRKDPEFYGPRFPYIPDDMPYFWPVQN